MTTTQNVAPATSTPRKLAITALVIGIIAALTSIVPVLGAVLGVAGVIFGAIALKKRQPKGLSLAGLILGALATVTSIAVTVTLIAFTGGLFGALAEASDGGSPHEWTLDENGDLVQDTGVSDTGEPGGGDLSARIPWDAFDTADAPLSNHAGTEEDPHPIGSRFVVDDTWEVVVNWVNMDAADQILALQPENAPPAPGERYVLLNMTLNNVTGEPERAGNLTVRYSVPGRLHSTRDRNHKITTPDPAISQDLQMTGNYTGYIAMRTKDVDGENLRFSGWASKDVIFVAVK